MTSRNDFPLPISDTSKSHDPWLDDSVHPTNLIILWPGEEPPTQAQVIKALSKQSGWPADVLAEPPPRDEKTLWNVVLNVHGLFEAPIIVWAEPVKPMSPETVQYLKAESIKWNIGVETLLFPNQALDHFVRLLKLVGRAFPDSPAILDVNKFGWHTREELQTILLPDDAALVESLLFMIHAVGTDNPPTPESRSWIYTEGLRRCGRPELELLEVPYPQVGAAMGLLRHVAEQILEGGMPQPGEPMEVGPDLQVVFQPWQEVAPYIDEKSLGGKDRVDHNGDPATGNRAVICAVKPQGTYRKLWVWPTDVVHRVAVTGNTVLYKTKLGAQLQAKIARATFDELVAVFAKTPAQLRNDNDNRQIVFLIKAGLPRTGMDRRQHGDRDDGREHLWFEVKQFKGGRAEGLLLNDPMSIEHLRQGDTARIDRGIVSDWQVLTRQGTFGPSNVDGLRQVIEQISGAATP